MSKTNTRACYHTEEIILTPLKTQQTLCSPKDIVEYLDRNIIGQERAKKSLAVAVYNHLRRIECSATQAYIPKSNILMQGSTGSGKTFLLKNLADFLDVPLVICDASIITEAGFKGKNVETILADLYHTANKDLNKAERGIVYLDEFDKLSSGMGSVDRRSNSGVGVGVQRQILKMIEGCIMTVPVSEKASIRMNTENILFICGGAFVGIQDDTQQKNKRPIGFLQEMQPKKNSSEKSRLTHQDFVEYGLIPEIVGRLPIIIELDTLTEDDFVNILLNSESSIIKSYQNFLKADDVELIFEEEAVIEIAHIAHSKNTGARGLNAIIEGVMEDIMFDIPSDPLVQRCIITKQAVNRENSPIIERQAI